MIQRRILVCCGTGIATSVQVSKKLQFLMKERGIQVEASECKALEVPAKLLSFKPHILVATTRVDPDKVGVPFFPGLPFLTAIGMQQAADEIAKTLQELPQ